MMTENQNRILTSIAESIEEGGLTDPGVRMLRENRTALLTCPKCSRYYAIGYGKQVVRVRFCSCGTTLVVED